MIQIRQKLIPFSHEPSSKSLIPNTNFSIQAWPTKFIVFNDKIRVEYNLQCTGPVENFTLKLDLEKGLVLCFFRSKEGYFCWAIQRVKDGIEFRLKRSADSGIKVNGRIYLQNDRFVLPINESIRSIIHNERLCLGSHKQQDIQKIFKRFDLKELLPLYFRLGQYFPASGSLNCLDELKRVHSCQISSLFYLSDSIHDLLGIEHTPIDHSFFAKAYCLIRDMFFKESESCLVFMSGSIPFNSGRLTKLECSFGFVSFIFRKKRVLRIVIDPNIDARVYLKLPQKCRQFRVLKSLRKKGMKHCFNQPLELKKSTRLYLDNFYF